MPTSLIRTVTARAPGKLFIAGEYAVVTPGQPAVIVAVDRLLTVTLTPRTEPGVTATSDAYDSPKSWRFGQQADDYLTAALHCVETLRDHHGLPEAGYDLEATSNLTRDGRKIGLGSSGAVTVAVVDAVGRAHGLALTRTQRYRIAMCATVMISPRASGGDIAASTWGGWIHYTSPDRDAVADSLHTSGVVATISDEAVWRGCAITALPTPPLELRVGWTGSPADTDTLVTLATASTTYPEFLADSADVVAHTVDAFHTGDAHGLITAMTRGREVLATFAAARATPIETPLLTALCDIAEAHGAGAKTSGAGGGDCGIAFAPASATTRILEQWEEGGIIALDLLPHRPQGDTP